MSITHDQALNILDKIAFKLKIKPETNQELQDFLNKYSATNLKGVEKTWQNSLEKLKKEKGELDKNLNKKITEKNGLITTLTAEIRDLKRRLENLEEEDPFSKLE